MKLAEHQIFSWRQSSALLGLVMALLCLQWHILDRRPPEWDQAMYMMDGLVEYQAGKAGGILGFYHAFLTVNPGRGGLLALLAQPGYFIFGPSPTSAILTFIILWPLAIWALSDFTYHAGRHLFGLDERAAGFGAVLSALLFVTYPMTEFLANGFLTEFPLITFILLTHVTALRYLMSGKALWSLALGLALLGGVLAKVTFPAFVIAPVTMVAVRYFRGAQLREIALNLSLICAPSLVVAAPFYIRNLRAVVAQTLALSSAEAASLYGLGGAWDLQKSGEFARALLANYEFLLCISAATLFVLIYVAKNRSTWRWLLVIAISFLIPVLIVGVSSFKQERYAYPAYGLLFALAGLGLSGPWMQRSRTLALSVSALLLLPPLVKTAATYSFLPTRAVSYFDPLSAGNMWRQADERDWKIPELVNFVNIQVVGDAPVVILGGSPAFHAALLQFASGGQRRYAGFSHQSNVRSTQDDLIRFLDETSSSGILYKTPPYEPEFLGKFVPEALQHISTSGDYRRLDVPVVQPDGSQFTLFIPTNVIPPKPQVEVISRGPVQGPHSPANSTLFNFADRYSESAIKFEPEKTRVAVALTFERIGAPVPGETVFFHLLNEKGDIIHQLDRPVCMGCNDPENVTIWTERFYIPMDIIGTFKSIGFGIYGPSSKTGPLAVNGGATDWDGHRAIMRVPIERDIRND